MIFFIFSFISTAFYNFFNLSASLFSNYNWLWIFSASIFSFAYLSNIFLLLKS